MVKFGGTERVFEPQMLLARRLSVDGTASSYYSFIMYVFWSSIWALFFFSFFSPCNSLKFRRICSWDFSQSGRRVVMLATDMALWESDQATSQL